MRWLEQFRLPRDDTYVCAYAAKGGHLDMLIRLMTYGYMWDHSTCSYAAMGGYLNVIKWAVHNGCRCDKNITFAVAFKNNDIKTWLLSNPPPAKPKFQIPHNEEYYILK